MQLFSMSKRVRFSTTVKPTQVKPASALGLVIVTLLLLLSPAGLQAQADPVPQPGPEPQAPPPAPPIQVRKPQAPPPSGPQPGPNFLYSIGQPTAEEQLYLEYINRS